MDMGFLAHGPACLGGPVSLFANLIRLKIFSPSFFIFPLKYDYKSNVLVRRKDEKQ